jgi:thioredoxin 1
MVDSYSYESTRHVCLAGKTQGLPVTEYIRGERMNLVEFIEEIKSGTTIVDFWAEWCGPCKMVTPVLEEIAKENNVRLLKINVDESKELASVFNLTSIPVIMLYTDGEKTKHIIGAKPKPALNKALFGDV